MNTSTFVFKVLKCCWEGVLLQRKYYKALSDANILQYKQQQKFTCLILKEAEYLHTYFMHHFCFFQKVFLDAVSADLQIQKN